MELFFVFTVTLIITRTSGISLTQPRPAHHRGGDRALHRQRHRCGVCAVPPLPVLRMVLPLLAVPPLANELTPVYTVRLVALFNALIPNSKAARRLFSRRNQHVEAFWLVWNQF